MDWKIQGKEITLEQPSLQLWRLRQLLLLGEKHRIAVNEACSEYLLTDGASIPFLD